MASPVVIDSDPEFQVIAPLGIRIARVEDTSTETFLRHKDEERCAFLATWEVWLLQAKPKTCAS